MKIQITDRDRKLLVLLGVMVAVVVIGYWGVRPLMKSTALIKEQIKEQEQIAVENEVKMMEFAFIKKANKNFEEEIEQMLLTLEPLKSSAQIDKDLTDRILKKGLDIREMTIKMPKGDMVQQPYRYAEKENEVDSEEQSVSTAISMSDYLDGELPESLYEPKTVTKTGVCNAKVSMTLRGERKVLESFLEELYATSPYTMQVKAFSFGKHADYEPEDADTMKVDLELYFRSDVED